MAPTYDMRASAHATLAEDRRLTAGSMPFLPATNWSDRLRMAAFDATRCRVANAESLTQSDPTPTMHARARIDRSFFLHLQVEQQPML